MFDRFCASARATLGVGAVAAVLVAGIAVAPAQAAPDAAYVVDAKTGKVLYSSNANAKRYPASLTKMMTLYLLFEALDGGKTTLDARMPVSAHAAAQAPSKLGLKAGGSIRVRDAILALVTKSANDAAVVIGEYLGGTETQFARLMTARARDLGMSRTVFRNASGLPNSSQITTAHDLAILGRALRDHYPQYYTYFSTPSFVWNGRRIANHNNLLGRVDGVDGIKTGYTRASGFNLVTSVDRGGRQIVAVVIGGETSRARDALMAQLVRTYLSKASAGKHVAVLIPGKTRGGAGPAVAVATADAPLPTLRPTQDGLALADDATDDTTVAAVDTGDTEDDAPAELADAAPAVITSAPVAGALPKDGPLTIADLAKGANSIFAYADTPNVLSGTTDDAEGDTSPADEPADAAPATMSPSLAGWRIQIAASPTKTQAEDLLDRALAKGATVLASAAPYTEPVAVNGSTLYRARFAGFSDKDAAWAACEYLKKQKFSCLAVSN